jgi:glycosyltransferase A (GT-A) superfamily protein (DUF2064 family)
VIAKRPAAGHSKTPLCPPLTSGQAAELHERMLVDTIALASNFGATAGRPEAARVTWDDRPLLVHNQTPDLRRGISRW